MLLPFSVNICHQKAGVMVTEPFTLMMHQSIRYTLVITFKVAFMKKGHQSS